MTAVVESQQDRCSAQRHLWRWHSRPGLDYMACTCGAVHPDDLDAFMGVFGSRDER